MTTSIAVGKDNVLMTKRQSNLELFRIVLMIGIIFGHAFRWGGFRATLVILQHCTA